MDAERAWFWIWMAWGALVVGGLCGLLPLLVGVARKKRGLAVGGFVACLIGAMIAGAIAALPIAIVFTVIIAVSKT